MKKLVLLVFSVLVFAIVSVGVQAAPRSTPEIDGQHSSNTGNLGNMNYTAWYEWNDATQKVELVAQRQSDGLIVRGANTENYTQNYVLKNGKNANLS